MRVLLVKPNNLSDHIQPSLGLAYLAQGIRSRYDVRILDCIKDGLSSTDVVAKVLEEYRPDLIGIQCYTLYLFGIFSLLYNPTISIGQ